MRLNRTLISVLLKFLLFLTLEAVCFYAISKNSIVQQFMMLENIREVQSFLWRQSTSIKSFFNLREINKKLYYDNYELFKQTMFYKEVADSKQGDAILNEFLMSHLQNDSLKNNDSLIIDIRNNTKIKEKFSYFTAKIVKNSIGSLHNYVIIDKGYEDGVTENMGVVTPFGIVGIVRAVGKHNSFVLSFLNNKQNVSAKIGNTEAFGPMVWDKFMTTSAVLNEIPQHIKFKIGDTVYTSGMSAFYPAHIPLGTIKDSKIKNGIHHSIYVELFQNPRNIDHVIVVKNNNRSEIDSLSTFSVQ